MNTGIPWEKMTPTLLKRWGGGAPRYTSYPTAVEWGEHFTHDDVVRALSHADRAADEPISIYVHIPFCRKRCLFCGCASDVCTDTARYDTYLDTLAREIEAVAARLPHRRRANGLHLGGGTPTVLAPSALERLYRMLSDAFDFSDAAEQALEAAPAVTHLEQIDTLAALGFNRVSFGVQDFTPKVQAAVDRVQSATETRALIDRARTHGMSVNLDLMYGLPFQTLPTWRDTLKAVTDIAPDRLAVFGYAHVPWMRPHQKEMDEQRLPDGDLRLSLFRAAHDHLVNAGYVYIGMDHFAKPDDALTRALAQGALWRNFQGYTVKQAGVLIGFGATAISDYGDAFAQNTPQTEAYEQAVAQNGNAVHRGLNTSEDDRLRRHIITELMCNLVLDIREVNHSFGIDFWTRFSKERAALDRLAEDALITYDENRIAVTPLGRMFVRHVGLAFDVYSAEKVAQSKFSRTV